MQESSDSDYNVQVKQEDEMLEQSSSPHLQKPNNKPFILLQEDDSDQLHFYRNKCKKKKKKNRLQIMNLNMGRWNRQQQKSFHLLLEVSFRTFINRMVFNKHFKMFARRREFLKMRSHGQTRGFLQKLQRKQNKSYIEIIGGYRRQFYNSLDPQHVQNELSKRGIQFEKILTIQQLQKLFNQTKELKKYMLNAKANENMLEMATAKAKKLKQLEQKKQEEQREKQKLRQKQAQEMREMMERYDPKNKKSKQSEYIPKKSKIICFTMDPLTFEIINKKQIEE